MNRNKINDAFETNWIAPLGPNVNAFEEELTAYVMTVGCAATLTGTAAIHLALELLGVGQGDTVFCSSLTFEASATPILYVGAEPVFIDSEEDTWNMSPVALARAFEHAQARRKLPKAVIAVNLYGQSAKMDDLMAICERYEVPLACVIIGLPDAPMKESKDRILSCLHALTIDISLKRITVHLSPPDKRKSGTGHDSAMLAN